MFNLSQITLLLLLQYTRESLGLFLRVETGHQNIAIDGRDVYYGHYTKIHFHNVTCIDAIDIHCLKELTGAEEIDLLYSECQKGHWKVAHYTNSKHHFRLKEPIHALRLLISSRRELSVIDAQVESCSNPPAAASECHRPTRNHNHRHGKPGSILRAVDPMARLEAEVEAEALVAAGINRESEPLRGRRVRRSVPDDQEEGLALIAKQRAAINWTMFEWDSEPKAMLTNKKMEFDKDVVIGHQQALIVSEGGRMKFHKGVGLIVRGGSIRITGTRNQPVIMEAAVPGERWRGVVFENASRDEESVLQNVNISGSEVAVNVVEGISPTMDQVIVERNTHGIQMANVDAETTTHLTHVTAVNNEKSGIEYLGKV